MSKEKKKNKQLRPKLKQEQNVDDQISVSQESQESFVNHAPFPSAELLLESARDEYTKERERTHFLDNKASFFMSAVILLATIFIPIIPFGSFIKFIDSAPCCQMFIFILACVGLATAFVLLIFSFKHLYDSYKIKEYMRFDIDNVDDQGVLKTSHNGTEIALCKNYKKAVVGNIKINDSKAEDIRVGIKLSAIGFLLLSIAAITLVILIG